MQTTIDTTSSAHDQLDAPGAIRPYPRWFWIVLGVAALLIFLRANKSDEDVRFWHYVAQCVHRGDWPAVYDKDHNPFAFAPYGHFSMAALLYPLGYLSKPAMRVVLIALIVGMWHLMHRFMMAGVEDRRQGFRGWIPLAAAGPALGMIIAGRFLLNDINLKQLNMITFTCGCIGLWLMMARRRGSSQLAGICLLSFSIALKLFTLPLLVMLVIKGAWRQAAAASAMTAGLFLLLPRLVMGEETYAELSQLVNSSTLNMWLQVEDTTKTWSFLNFVHYRIFVQPLWPGLESMPPRVYQAICVVITMLVGLPTLHVMLRCRWRDMTPTRLWEEIAMVGVAWALIDPDGRTAHFVTLVPAFGLIAYRTLDAWQRRRERPRPWEWMMFAVVGMTTLYFVGLPAPITKHWYMHSGLFSVGLISLYAMTYRTVWRGERRTNEQLASSLAEPPVLTAA